MPDFFLSGGLFQPIKGYVCFAIDPQGKIIVKRLDELDRALETVRIADPAVGSGAFLLGLLNEVVQARQNITAYMAIPLNARDRRMLYNTDRSPYRLRIDIDDYPAIKQHLDRYYKRLAKRADKGLTPYNLRNCGMFINNECFMISGSHLIYLIAFLNISIMENTLAAGQFDRRNGSGSSVLS